MEIKTYPLYMAGQLREWAKGTVVKDAKGFVFLSGTEGRHPETDEVVEGIYAQTRMCYEKIKSRLEEMGSSLDKICHRRWYIASTEFPDGVQYDPKFREAERAEQDFFKEHCPQLCIDKNPPAGTLVSVPALSKKGMLVEIEVIVAL